MNVGLLPVMGLIAVFFHTAAPVNDVRAALGIAAGVRMREKPSYQH